MSVPEPCIASSLNDILAFLEAKPELEEAIEKVPLTQALEQSLLFAQANNLNDLAKFIQQELDGYSGELPNHRTVQLSYFDRGGQIINGLEQYRVYPLATGVRKLELHLKNGLTLILPKQISNFLSETSGREVDSGHISPPEIYRLLEKIRDLMLKKLRSV